MANFFVWGSATLFFPKKMKEEGCKIELYISATPETSDFAVERMARAKVEAQHPQAEVVCLAVEVIRDDA